MAEVIMGLDIETSAGNPDGRLIAIGVSFGTEPEQNFYSLVQPHDWWWMKQAYAHEALNPRNIIGVWEDQAQKVHGLTFEDIDAAPPAAEVDTQLYEWLLSKGVGPKDGIAVGFNVGSFDMPFVRRELPTTGTLFHYRSVDLNSLAFGLAERGRLYKQKGEQVVGYEGWKRLAKRFAISVLGTEDEHNALWDAKSALIAFRFLATADRYRELVR